MAPDLPRIQPAAITRRRMALLRRSTAIAARVARIDARRPPLRRTLQHAPRDTRAVNINLPPSPSRPPMLGMVLPGREENFTLKHR